MVVRQPSCDREMVVLDARTFARRFHADAPQLIRGDDAESEALRERGYELYDARGEVTHRCRGFLVM